MGLFFHSCNENKTTNLPPLKINWDTLAVIPSPVEGQVQYGLSGLIGGVTGNSIVVAGGSNFKGKVPWEGGIKTYYSDLYVLKMGRHESSWNLVTKIPFSFELTGKRRLF
jgi:N-acetylneuraminic acid mutarotase